MIQMPALLPGVRCNADASTTPDQPSMQPRMAGLGVFFLNTQVQPVHAIYIKAVMTNAASVLMAEAAALALAATVNDALNINNTAFLSDCQQLVHFLNDADQTNPPDWRIKYFTQLFANCAGQRRAKIYEVNRQLNTTANTLARQALSASSSSSTISEPVCSNSDHHHHCPVMNALLSVNLNSVSIIAARCC